ncbi:MAG TPA: ABC transporter permease [Longimicrobiaceae bacterium]|nr:ABC transporter permease [Longimicrobiaceae bacterium]
MSAIDFIAQVIRIAVPYLFAAAGGVLAERSGIISLELEGFMLAGAFGGAVGSYATGSPWVGLACGLLGGLVFSLIHAVSCIRYKADQVVVGIAINLLAIGVTRFFLRLFFGSSSNSPRVVGFGDFLGFSSPLIPVGLLAIPLSWWVLTRTPFGLRIRAAGEHPGAARSVGVSVDRVRYLAVAASGMLAGLGGVYLAFDQHQFTDQMTAGRGYIAIAAVIFGSWKPIPAGLACLLFAVAETAQIHMQGVGGIPSQFVAMIPYVLTIVALAGVVGRSLAPSALGKPDA